MARIVIEVMPRAEARDAAGETIAGVLRRIGYGEFTGVRQGRRFELSSPGEATEALLERGRAVAEEILANPLTEEVTAVYALEQAGSK